MRHGALTKVGGTARSTRSDGAHVTSGIFGSKRLRLRRKVRVRSGCRPEILKNFRRPVPRVENIGFATL